ncbi:transposase [Meiothermus sp. QL-1]|uniref:RNA-guided endonuclease InsQ/TnpB family protein n=1 Tax=Meiothermus sp. QL-1 TaxID=2058095 RepID=UPI001F16BED9|nr:transposase [Meiothermus sp. QL-1]
MYILDLTRELYNAALQERRDAWRKAGKSVALYEQMRLLGEVKAARPEYREVYAQVLQETLKRLDRAFQGFFSRLKRGEKPGYPRFKGRGWWDSFTFPQVVRGGCWVGPGKPLGNGKVKVPGVGHVRMKQHRPLEGVPKTFSIKRSAGCWYAVYVCEVQVQPLPPSENAVGIDLGLSHFVATSEGETFAPPKAYRKAEARLKRTQRSLSKKRRASNRRRKLKERLARQHRKVANQRRDFHHKLARKLVNQYGTIVHEDLNTSGLARSRLAKGVLDAGWASFISILSAKAASAGRRVVAVRPHGTSQICPECGSIRKKELSERIHACGCGCVLDRDVAAAKVILALGLDGALGDGQRVAASA